MSIESSKPAPASHAATAGAQRSGKQAGKPDTGMTNAGSGFAALMNLLQADEPAVIAADGALIGVAANALAGLPPGEKPLVSDIQAQWAALEANPAGANPALDSLPLPTPGLNITLPLTNSDSTAVSPSLDDSVQSPILAGIQAKSGLASQISNALGMASTELRDPYAASLALEGGAGQKVADEPAPSPLTALSGHKSGTLGNTLSAVQQELREMKAPISALTQAPTEPNAAMILMAAGSSDAGARSQEKSGSKSPFGRSDSGVDGAQGATSAPFDPARAVFEVSDPSAVIPEASIAETVSYWVSHGVQSAELKLEGFGNDPVEVSISLNGDQAQIEFRTDQADVRQALENASAQLKELLSGEGLNLTGMSVGGSGKDNTPKDETQQRPQARKATFNATPAVSATMRPSVNPAVGRGLDVFV